MFNFFDGLAIQTICVILKLCDESIVVYTTYAKEIIMQEQILASCVNLLATLNQKCLFPCNNKGFFIEFNSLWTFFFFFLYKK